MIKLILGDCLEKMNDKKYFEVFTKYQDDMYELYNKIKALIQEEVTNARGIENAKAYDVLTKLINSENNVGWEDRHSERIAMINKAQSDIVDEYERYLP